MPVEAAQLAFEIREALRGARDLDGAGGVKERNSRAVVPSVFKLSKTAQENRRGFFPTQISKNPAHIPYSSKRM
jgi:hypothetical protein